MMLVLTLIVFVGLLADDDPDVVLQLVAFCAVAASLWDLLFKSLP